MGPHSDEFANNSPDLFSLLIFHVLRQSLGYLAHAPLTLMTTHGKFPSASRHKKAALYKISVWLGKGGFRSLHLKPGGGGAIIF